MNGQRTVRISPVERKKRNRVSPVRLCTCDAFFTKKGGDIRIDSASRLRCRDVDWSAVVARGHAVMRISMPLPSAERKVISRSTEKAPSLECLSADTFVWLMARSAAAAFSVRRRA
jgi:hypothetical protein